MDQEKVNVEEIMQEIREKLKENWEDIPSFESIPIFSQSSVPEDYEGEVNAMNRTWNLEYAWPLSPNPIKRLSQRVIKRLLKFLFVQIIYQQNEFNAHATRAMDWTKKGVDNLTTQMIEMEQEMEEIKAQMEELMVQNKGLVATKNGLSHHQEQNDP